MHGFNRTFLKSDTTGDVDKFRNLDVCLADAGQNTLASKVEVDRLGCGASLYCIADVIVTSAWEAGLKINRRIAQDCARAFNERTAEIQLHDDVFRSQRERIIGWIIVTVTNTEAGKVSGNLDGGK